MLKYINSAILIFLTFFIVEYEGYDWNPCDGSWCLSINCPMGVCHAEGQTYFVETIQEAQEILNRNGIDHLSHIYRVDWSPATQQAQVFELSVIPSYVIHDTSQETWPSGITFDTDGHLIITPNTHE